VKLAIIGGGGFRVPLVYGALLKRRPFDEVVLHDVDPERLERIAQVLEGQAAEHGERLPFRTTTDLDDALEGAGFVFIAIRVGGLEGRTVDEGVPLGQGVLGQETIGAGGICFALRTIPAMVDLAERTVRRAPGAWLVNFTNPAGMVTEALQQVVGDRAVGICDTPSGLCRRIAATLRRSTEELRFDYFGLNHLGWLKAVHDESGDRLPELLADDAALDALDEGRLFGAEWVRSLGMVPSEYLYYFYFAAETVAALERRPRGAYLLEQQARFYAAADGTPQQALARWRAVKDERDRTYMAEARNGHEGGSHGEDEPGGYEAEALAVVEAIASGAGAVRILNVANRSALPFLDEHAVVEVPCVVGASGIRPIAVGPVPDHARALIDTVKAVERTTIEAALTGSTALAVKALALHPLVPSVKAARAIFAGYRERLPALEERFA
jgi:6-phospho-beta-glucosidase